MSTELHYLGHALAASFEANLAYSIVSRLSNFAATPIKEWIAEQLSKVELAMDGTPTFNKIRFKNELEEMLEKFNADLDGLNYYVLRGAFGAAIIAIVVLILIVFNPHWEIPTWFAVLLCTFLFFPMVGGLIGVLILQKRDEGERDKKTEEIDNMIDRFRGDAAAQVKKIGEALSALESPSSVHE